MRTPVESTHLFEVPNDTYQIIITVYGGNFSCYLNVAAVENLSIIFVSQFFIQLIMHDR